VWQQARWMQLLQALLLWPVLPLRVLLLPQMLLLLRGHN
jgi:hypothetical protein